MQINIPQNVRAADRQRKRRLQPTLSTTPSLYHNIRAATYVIGASNTRSNFFKKNKKILGKDIII
jgi:hypothetical protein